MKLIKSLVLSSLLLAVVFIAGCNEQPTTSNGPVNTGQQFSKFSLPPGATLNSAILHIYIDNPNYEIVNIHAISSDWDETTVNWNSKPSLYPGVEASFSTDVWEWKTVDITGLVDKWLDGTYDNFGLLLDQIDPDLTWAQYDSKEAPNMPYLEINYSGGSENVADIADAYISELYPTYNFNTDVLYTGYIEEKEKQSLLKFDVEYVPEVSCETAYAKGPNAICFLDIENKQGNNWGWTNEITGPGSWNFDVYAGAGQCDENKGTLVGTLDVTYNGTTVTVFYNIDSGFTLDETHLWVGSGMLPVKRGKYVSNPGGFNYNGQNPVSVNIAAPFYIAAHSVVCGNY